MSNKTAIQYVRDGLIADGFDGLFAPNGECACQIGSLAPCGESSDCCMAGYKVPCDGSLMICGGAIGCNFHIVAEKPEPECDECNDTGKFDDPLMGPHGGSVTYFCTCPAGQKLREGSQIHNALKDRPINIRCANGDIDRR